MKKTFVITIYAVVCLVALAIGVWCFLPHDVWIVENGVSGYRIEAESGSEACEAAASYLSRQIRERTDAIVPFAAGQTDGAQILLRVGFDPDTAYSLELDGEKNLIFSFADAESAMPAVKAVCDVWLQEGVGLKNGGLRISRSMIQNQLSDLSVAADESGSLLLLAFPALHDDAAEEEELLRQVEDLSPDLISTQLLTAPQMEQIRQKLEDRYYIMGLNLYGSDDAGQAWNAVLFRRDRFRFADGDSFWLSDVPYVPGSSVEGTAFPGLCTWVVLRDLQTGRELFLGNSSLQPGSSEADEALRAQQLGILLDTLRADSGVLDLAPGFVTGGLSLRREEAAYASAVSLFSDAAAAGPESAEGAASLPAQCLYTQSQMQILEARQTGSLGTLSVRALLF